MGEHRSFPKPPPRLIDRIASKRLAEQAWTNCKRLVDARDRFRCRCCQRRLRRTLTLAADRLEHHHIVRRSVWALRDDPRNVLTVCLTCHGRLTRHELVITGTAVFEVGGRWYFNADYLLTFLPSEPCEQPSIESALIPDPKDDAMTD